MSPLISALGANIRIDVSALEVAETDEVVRVWAGAASSPSDGSSTVHDTVVAPAGVPIERMLSSLSGRVTHAAIEARRGEMWMLHAAGVADEQGRVVVMIGPSGRGKTTAVRALAQRYAYVSDETIGIDADGRVFPYRKPLSIIESVGAVKAQRSPSELGLRALPEASLQVAALVLLDRRADSPDAAVVERCDFGDAIEELVGQTSYLADLRAPLQTLAAHVRAVGGVHRVIYREAESLVDGLAPLFRTPLARNVAEVDAAAEALVHHLTAAPDSPDATAADGWYRAPVARAVAELAAQGVLIAQRETRGEGGATPAETESQPNME